MQLEIINESKVRIPRKFLSIWIQVISKNLLKKKILEKQDLQKNLSLVFLNTIPAKKINLEFRGKNYATDVLSFTSMSPDSLGELVMCPQVLQRQSKEHHLSFQTELGYMVLHGILHLKGYDHEKSAREAQIMFQIQDETFEKALMQLRKD